MFHVGGEVKCFEKASVKDEYRWDPFSVLLPIKTDLPFTGSEKGLS